MLQDNSAGEVIMTCCVDMGFCDSLSHLVDLTEQVTDSPYQLTVAGRGESRIVTLRDLPKRSRERLGALWQPARSMRWARLV